MAQYTGPDGFGWTDNDIRANGYALLDRFNQRDLQEESRRRNLPVTSDNSKMATAIFNLLEHGSHGRKKTKGINKKIPGGIGQAKVPRHVDYCDGTRCRDGDCNGSNWMCKFIACTNKCWPNKVNARIHAIKNHGGIDENGNWVHANDNNEDNKEVELEDDGKEMELNENGNELLALQSVNNSNSNSNGNVIEDVIDNVMLGAEEEEEEENDDEIENYIMNELNENVMNEVNENVFGDIEEEFDDEVTLSESDGNDAIDPEATESDDNNFNNGNNNYNMNVNGNNNMKICSGMNNNNNNSNNSNNNGGAYLNETVLIGMSEKQQIMYACGLSMSYVDQNDGSNDNDDDWQMK